jgi:hypothetical protein
MPAIVSSAASAWGAIPNDQCIQLSRKVQVLTCKRTQDGPDSCPALLAAWQDVVDGALIKGWVSQGINRTSAEMDKVGARGVPCSHAQADVLELPRAHRNRSGCPSAGAYTHDDHMTSTVLPC